MAALRQTFFYTVPGHPVRTVILLLTPAYTAGAVAEEKERRTLEFILATDLRNREIILGKVLSRLLNLTPAPAGGGAGPELPAVHGRGRFLPGAGRLRGHGPDHVQPGRAEHAQLGHVPPGPRRHRPDVPDGRGLLPPGHGGLVRPDGGHTGPLVAGAGLLPFVRLLAKPGDRAGPRRLAECRQYHPLRVPAAGAGGRGHGGPRPGIAGHAGRLRGLPRPGGHGLPGLVDPAPAGHGAARKRAARGPQEGRAAGCGQAGCRASACTP